MVDGKSSEGVRDALAKGRGYKMVARSSEG